MRARNIKPGFFKNEELAECDPFARILFQGLWCYCDREGRFKWKPKRIKAEILPYDELDIASLLETLREKGLILKYNLEGENYGWIPKFLIHQKPHPHESISKLPEPPADIYELNQCNDKSITCHDNGRPCNDISGESESGQKPQQNQCHDKNTPCNDMSLTSPAESLNPESLNPESLNPKESGKPAFSENEKPSKKIMKRLDSIAKQAEKTFPGFNPYAFIQGRIEENVSAEDIQYALEQILEYGDTVPSEKIWVYGKTIIEKRQKERKQEKDREREENYQGKKMKEAEDVREWVQRGVKVLSDNGKPIVLGKEEK